MISSVKRKDDAVNWLLLDRASFANLCTALNSVFKSSDEWVFARAHQSYLLKMNLGCFFSALIAVGDFRFEEARSTIFSASSTSPPRKHPRNTRVTSSGEQGAMAKYNFKAITLGVRELTVALTLIFTCEKIVFLEQNNNV